MKTIYFDQFAISSMSGPDIPDIWNKIRNIILNLKRQNKILCCTSSETIFETSQRNSTGIIDNYSTISELMNNCYLNDTRTIICQQIAKSIKGIESNPFIQVNHDYTSSEFNFNLRHAIHSEFDCIHIPLCPIDITKDNLTYITDLFLFNRKGNFIDSIDSFLLNKAKNSIYIDICNSLVKSFNFTTTDFVQLRNRIYNDDFSISPTLNIHNKLEPYITFSRLCKKTKIDFKNDIFDIRRLSTAIPYCNVILCDNRWKNCIKDLNINSEYNIVAFSAKKADLIEFENYLYNI